MLTLKGHVTGSGPMGSPKQKRQPIKSWTSKTVKTSERSRQNGIINSPRGLYGRGKIPMAAKLSVGGEWALKECEEHTTWLNGILKKHKSRPISDLRKSISDGLTLVNILEILFNSKIKGVQTRPIIRAQRLENINLCLRFLENRGVDIQHISADELTDSNLRATLALVTCLRKRFEAFHTSSSAHGGGSSTSIDKSVRPPTEISLQPSLGRDVSIHSFQSQLSLHSQHSDGSLARSKSTDMPAAIPSEDEESLLPISPAPINGDADLIPGTMADSDPDEPRPESADKPEATVIPTVTELDSQGVSQHGGGLKKQQFTSSPKKSFRPPVTRQHSSIDGEHSSMLSPVRDAVSQSVEERLKSLLDSPTPGRKFNRNISQQRPPIDDGELLEPPPPRRPSYANDDDNEERETTFEENKLQAMLEDPDNFEDYPKDWDRYVSGYVPSHSTEKMEGPRAQRLLDRQAPPPSQASSGQGRTLPFFHAPPSQHMGPLQTASRMDNQAPLMNGSQSLPIRNRLSQGSMYSDDGRNNRPYDMPPPGARFQMQCYRQEDESASLRKTLPSYTDHIQRHPPKSHSSNSNNPNALYVPEGSRQQNMMQQQQQQRYPQDWQQPNRRGDQFQRWGDYDQWRDFDQMAPDADHQRGRKYLNHMQNGGPPNQRGIPMEELPRRSDSHYGQGGPNRDSKNPYIYLDRASSDQRNQPYLMNGNIHSSRDYAFSQSGSSSRSSTPPLPPLSPDNSDIESTPNSPYFNKKAQRSISVGVLPSRFQFPLYGPKDSNMGQKKRKGNTNRNTSAHKGFEPKSAARKSAGKGKRKMGKVKSSSSLGPASETAPNKRKSPNNRALPTVPHPNLHQVNEHTENTDSDRSSHHSNQQPSDTEDSDSASKLSPLPSKSPLKITDAHQQSATESVEPPDPDNIRRQLVDLERMYNEILQVIGNDRKERLLENPGDRRSVSSMSTTSGKTPNKNKAPSAKVVKRRDKDIKQVNKRFARVESHVVTLARSVAHLSSELRSQNAMFHEIESLRHEINQLRDMQVLNASDVLNGGMRFRPIVPLCSNPNKIKKLTKFFGEEPPMLTMFLKDLGYEKYSSLFEKEGIGMVELPYLSEERLETIGVPIGPRLRILQEAQLMV